MWPSPTNIPRGCQASMRRGTMTMTTTTAVEASDRARRRPRAKKKCQSFVTPWPFDNHYEEVLEARYEELATRTASEYGTPDNNRTEGTRAVATATRRRTIGRGGRIARGLEGEGRLTTRAEGGEDDKQQGGGAATARPSLTNVPRGCLSSRRRGAMTMTTTTTMVEASCRARRPRAKKKCRSFATPCMFDNPRSSRASRRRGGDDDDNNSGRGER